MQLLVFAPFGVLQLQEKLTASAVCRGERYVGKLLKADILERVKLLISILMKTLFTGTIKKELLLPSD